VLKAPREVIDPRGSLREMQKALHRNILLPYLTFSPASHGGIPRRSQITNVMPHVGHAFVYTADIKRFFPSIHFSRVTRLFLELGCSDEVSRLLTRICTYDYCLAQGFVTSPLLADQVFRSADDRISKLCEKLGLAYTRFVDDLSISGPFDLKKSGLAKTLATILHKTGFKINTSKSRFGTIAEGAPILNLQLKKGRPDVAKDYYEETVRRLEDAASLGTGGAFAGPYYGHAELYGRTHYVCWVNPNRTPALRALWRRLDWGKIEEEAQRRGIIKHKRYRTKRV
jgi:RNA-directed DNA polymerase